MPNHVRQEFQLRQGQILAPRLQQSVKFLQMSTLEFRQAIEQALASNPFLEDAEEDEDPSPDTTGSQPESAEAGAPDPDPAPAPEVSDTVNAMPAGNGPLPLEREAATTLADRLLQALSTIVLGARDRALALYVIDSLDSDGYLRPPLESLHHPADFDPPPEASEWRTALSLVQQLDAPGLAARDLPECLSLQLQAMLRDRQPEQPPATLLELALHVVRHHLPRLARRDWPALARELGVHAHDLALARDVIRGLDPHPGRRYDADIVTYVIPDVMVDRHAGSWRIRSNPAGLPRLRVHAAYADWCQRAQRDDRGPLDHEIQEARWLVRNIEQRHTTIRRVAEAIVQRQGRFFEYGDVALRPLMLREIADDLGLHESTVSRATVHKYMMTPRGLFEFRHFFSRRLDTDAGGACSASAVRALIRELVDAENPRDPLSDVKLTQALAGHGIPLARRTVTKYRTQQKIPSVEWRRLQGAGEP